MIPKKSQSLNVCVVLPAYNAEKTLKKTYYDIPNKYRNNVILVDDASHDRTTNFAKKLNLHVHRHKNNRGYGANQKTCYRL
ncbi:glycosyl transferase family 2, partial [Candidatus Berkelbacteria bacterium CG_4_9_14_3_um_filter_33_5]